MDFIEKAVNDCLKGKRKTRKDVVSMFEEYGDAHNIALKLQSEINSRSLELKPIWYKRKWDEASHKWRNIGMQDIKQQMYDYIAVNAMSELLTRIGHYQCASIRRAFMRFERKPNNIDLARRVISYYGILKHSDNYNFSHKYNVYALHSKARKVVSNENPQHRKAA